LNITYNIIIAMTSHFLFVTGSDSQSIVQRLYKLQGDPTYTELYISLIEIDDLVANAIIDVLKNNERTWEGIHLAHCTGQVDTVISSALALGSVQKLTLLPDGGSTVNDKCLYALASGLPTNQSVTSLVIRVNLYKKLAIALAEGLSTNTGLQELSLILSTSDASAIAALARGIQTNSTLRSLKLNRCSLEDGQVADLVRALENHPSLCELSVQGSSCRAMGIIAISGLLQESSNMKPLKLDLSNQDFEENEMFGISFLAPSLPSNKSMRFLDLSSNHLTDAHVTCLASALSENSTLEELRLVNCNISEKGAKLLAAKLPQMRGLKTLWLYGNLFGRAGATALLQAVKINVHMEQLLLPRSRDNTEPMDDIQKEMEYYLILNRGGRQMLTHPQVPSGLWPHILQKAGSVDGDDYDYYMSRQARPNAMYCLLQGPALFSS
jgi:Ran GTPase-activating protein (RanGAP) involved in mRNA processing and transport